MMKLSPITVVTRTDKGKVREINEDSVAALESHGLVILADGMGGYNAGEVASQLAVETITTSLLPLYDADRMAAPEVTVRLAIEAANGAIREAVETTRDYEGMATTIVMALFCGGQVHFGHVGDSRLYRLRDGQLQQLTRDHSMIQSLVDEGMFASIQEALEAGVKNNILFRGLGIDDEVEVDMASATLIPEDRYLFCSDGLSNMLSDHELAQILTDSPQDLELAADRLLSAALDKGGLDNISLALVCPGNDLTTA